MDSRDIYVTSNSFALHFLKRAIYTCLCPLDFTRTHEIQILLRLIHKYFNNDNAEVLDIASPQLLACNLAATSPSWSITYMNSMTSEIKDIDFKKSVLNIPNISTLYGDVRLSDIVEPCSFDLIVSASVFEHITDINGTPGDTIGIQNVARWLKPHGLFIFSVPFCKAAFDEYKPMPQYLDKDGKEGNYFFQRFYDPTTLSTRLIEPSGLHIERFCYTGERYLNRTTPRKRWATLLSGSFLKHMILGRLYPLLTKILLVVRDDHSSLRKPYIAYGVLKKC